jgi:hypothetical protein
MYELTYYGMQQPSPIAAVIRQSKQEERNGYLDTRVGDDNGPGVEPQDLEHAAYDIRSDVYEVFNMVAYSNAGECNKEREAGCA